MKEFHVSTRLSRNVAFSLCLVFSLIGVGLGLWGGLHWRELPLPKNSSLANATTGRLPKNTQSRWKMCAADASSDIYGVFRELDCWITLLRISKPDGYLLDKKIFLRFTALYRRLQREPITENTPARWKMLYNLGTRLYPRQNQWAASATIPVYEMNGHHHAFTFWLKESKRRKLGPLFHIDSHDDMVAVPRAAQVLAAVRDLRNNRNVKKAWHTITHTINDCSMPVTAGVLAGLFQTVVWGKSEDVFDFPTFLSRSFFFGQTRKGVPEVSRTPNLSLDEADKLSEKVAEVKKKPSRFRLYYDATRDRTAGPMPWNYGWIRVAANQRPVRKKFQLYRPFQFSIINISKPIDEDGKGEGASDFQKLLKAIPRGQFTLDIDIDFFASVDTTPEFSRKMGNDPSLDFKPKPFQENRKILEDRLEYFEDLLLALRNHGRIPSMINIADSTFLVFALDYVATGQSEFTPIEHAAYIRRRVRRVLHDVYGLKTYNGRPRILQNIIIDEYNKRLEADLKATSPSTKKAEPR